MMKKALLLSLIFVLVLSSVFFIQDRTVSINEKEQITEFINNFSQNLKNVSLTSPQNVVKSEIQKAYSRYLDKKLLKEWEQNPKKALGRITSSPWPDTIEIDKIKKVGGSRFLVFGKIIYVTSGNGDLQPAYYEPVEITIAEEKENGKKSLRITSVKQTTQNENLLFEIKKSFPELKEIGKNGEPVVIERVDFTGDGVPDAVVDTKTGGAYTEYYTVCVSQNGQLKTAKFKDKNGHTGPMLFAVGSSVKHKSELKFVKNKSGNYILYYYVISKNDEGEITDISVNAYEWNKAKKLFEYNPDYSQKIKDSLKNELTTKSAFLSDLKYEKIKTPFPAIGGAFPYEGKVAFSCGTGKLVPNTLSSANINRIAVYNTNDGEFEYSEKAVEGKAAIDYVQMNKDWILFRNVTNESSTYFSINRKTGKISELLKNYKWDKSNRNSDNFSIGCAILDGNYADLIIKNSVTTRLIRENLNTGQTKEYFERSGKSFTVSSVRKIGETEIALNSSEINEKGSIVNKIYMIDTDDPQTLHTYQLPNYIDVCKLTPDKKIIYVKGQNLLIAPLGSYENAEIIFSFPQNFPGSINEIVSSKNYICFPFDNGNIFVYNRKTKSKTVIKGLESHRESLSSSGDELTVTRFFENKPDDIIYINLAENNF